MDRYYLFRKVMDLVAEDFEVTDADMKNYAGEIEVSGSCPDGVVHITVKLGEVAQDGN